MLQIYQKLNQIKEAIERDTRSNVWIIIRLDDDRLGLECFWLDEDWHFMQRFSIAQLTEGKIDVVDRFIKECVFRYDNTRTRE